MYKHNERPDMRTRLVLIAVMLIGLACTALAQSTWNDIRHEVTVRNDPQSFVCTVVNSTATTLTALGGSCAAPTVPGQSIYITDITASASVISTTTADQQLELKSGTTVTNPCDTGTAVIWSAFSLAFTPVPASFNTPIKVAANSAVCWMHAAAGNKTFIVTGYIK